MCRFVPRAWPATIVQGGGSSRRLPAAIPAAPAPMIKTSKSGSLRGPARAGRESAEARPAIALRRVSLRVFSDAGAIDCPTKTDDEPVESNGKSSMARRVCVARTTDDSRFVFHAHGVINFFNRFHFFLCML